MQGSKILAGLVLIASLFATGNVARASDCGPAEFRRIANAISGDNSRLIASLKERIASAKMSSVKLIEETPRPILDVGYIQNDDAKLVKLIGIGVRSGAFEEVRCGSVVGPKAVTYLSRLTETVPLKSDLKFTGKLNPKDLIESQIEEAEMGIRNRVTDSGTPEPLFWGPREVSDFRSAFEKLKVREACQRIYGTTRLEDCGPMNFVITPGSGQFHFEKP